MRQWWTRLLLVLVASSISHSSARADNWPSKPVKIIVQTAAGASIDVAARLLAESLTRKWGHQVVVLNQPGAGGAIAAKALAAAHDEEHTLLLAASSIFVVLPHLQPQLAEEVSQFIPLAFVGEQPMAVVVSGKEQVSTVSELIAAVAKASGGWNCAVSTRGGLSHLSGEAFREAANLDLKFVFYPGTSQALSDVIAGRVPMLVDSLSAFVGPASNGQIRIVAVGSPARLPQFPDIPSISETVPGFAATAWLALVAQKSMPQDLSRKISEEVQAVVASPEFTARMTETGTYPKAMSRAELTAFISGEKEKWTPIVRAHGGGPN